MPKNIAKRRMHCLEVMQKDSPYVLPHNSDGNDGVLNISQRDEAEYVVVKALLGIAQGLPKDDTSNRKRMTKGKGITRVGVMSGRLWSEQL